MSTPQQGTLQWSLLLIGHIHIFPPRTFYRISKIPALRETCLSVILALTLGYSATRYEKLDNSLNVTSISKLSKDENRSWKAALTIP